ncbi:hypothetical protein H5410_034585 [Solanum commersonii]|uniref:Uncharacterized protein n=1 Tax=Solanum commersonii TaxID=4109 RepID=A0A9J5YTT5_SOLCO|nr:hypothetical protein H5410_034585 [Solanum commersonii]
MGITIGHMQLDELEIIESDASLFIQLMHNINLLLVQKFFAANNKKTSKQERLKTKKGMIFIHTTEKISRNWQPYDEKRNTQNQKLGLSHFNLYEFDN